VRGALNGNKLCVLTLGSANLCVLAAGLPNATRCAVIINRTLEKQRLRTCTAHAATTARVGIIARCTALRSYISSRHYGPLSR
jgi:hypothetical protein